MSDATKINGRSLDERTKEMLGELATWAVDEQKTAEIARHHLAVCYELFQKQADEIERLRSEVDGYRSGFDTQHEEIERLRKELRQIKSLLFDSVHGVHFMHDQRKAAFQKQGQYDGAMSEECKASFRRQHEAWDSLIAERDALAAEAALA